MTLRVLALAFFAAGAIHAAGPSYTAAGIVNAADYQAGFLAPNTFASIYGTGLAYGTKAITSDDIRGGVLPTVLPGTGVRVLVGGILANLFYVSPLQINLLVPPSITLGPSTLQVVLDSTFGPEIPIQITAAAPALFQLDNQNAVATRAGGSVISPDNPARPGDEITLYATGLGQTVPAAVYSEVPARAAPLKQLADFKVLLDGAAVDPTAIEYAGLAPGFAGLYQINLKLPNSTGPNPVIRIGVADQLGKDGLHLPVKNPATPNVSEGTP